MQCGSANTEKLTAARCETCLSLPPSLVPETSLAGTITWESEGCHYELMRLF
jgi:hypothetical protein